MSRLEPPSGYLPPSSAKLGDQQIDLGALATTASDRFFAEFPDEYERNGEVGVEWCRHDLQWVFAWAAGDVGGHVDAVTQVQWLARILANREYPLERLARSLEIAAEVAEAVPNRGSDLASVLLRAGAAVKPLD